MAAFKLQGELLAAERLVISGHKNVKQINKHALLAGSQSCRLP